MDFKKFTLVAALMAAPMASFATDYFVTPRRGTGDGSSWDNAMSLDAFREKVGDASTDIHTYYFAGGDYVIAEPLKILKKGCSS